MPFRIYFPAILLLFHPTSIALAQGNPATEQLRFTKGEGGTISFHTGVLKGLLRKEGKSIGLVPVTYISDGSEIAAGEGLFNHYRVFTKGKGFGYGARRWPSRAKLLDDGSVEVIWPLVPDRPFELRASYRWIRPNTLDLITTLQSESQLEAFEVFLASYYGPNYTDSRVWASRHPLGEDKAGFVFADREFGEWLAFPRDELAEQLINDGRWMREPHPLEWTMMPRFDLPLAIRRDIKSGLVVMAMTKRDGCLGIFTPFSEEKHISNYFSLFGFDIQNGETAQVHSRLVVLYEPTEMEILKVAKEFFTANP